MPPRKKWATQPHLMSIHRTVHRSKPAAYRAVQDWVDEYRTGNLNPRIRQIEVLVNEGLGRGWELYETLSLAELAAVTEEN